MRTVAPASVELTPEDSALRNTSSTMQARAFRPRLFGLILSVLFCLHVLPSAAQGFVVEDIRLDGLQRMAPGTVFGNLPVKAGDTFDLSRSGEVIRALFKTGLFTDVRVEREGNTLVLFLVERPSIASIDINGNRELDTEALMESLSQVDFAVGRIFDKSVFDQVEQELRRGYFAIGRYGVEIVSTVTPLERNRVGVQFDIKEGKTARIKEINIVGNSVFDDDDLLDLFTLQPTGIWSVFTRDDQYSKQKLSADLEAVRSHYLDQGYVSFNIDSTQVSITPNKEDVYVTVNVTEGDQYTVKAVRLAGNLILDENEFIPLVQISEGDVFSRQRITATQEALATRLGQDGYAFANVNAVPELEEGTQEVTLTFIVDPGKRVYVRRINFAGNNKTIDEVLRREMRQMEGAWISTTAVERSKERLQRLTFFEEVNVETPAVPGTSDQVDVNFTVVEAPSGSFLLGAGFSQTQGVIISTSLTQENFLGTGNRLTASFNNSDVNRNFALGWFDPYFTDDGVSRDLEVFYRKTSAADANLADFDLDQLAGRVEFGLPISEFNSFNFGFTAEQTDFTAGSDASDEVVEFGEQFDNDFLNFPVNARFAIDTRDNVLLPNKGFLTRVTGELALPFGDLKYYKVTFRHNQYVSLWKDWVVSLNGDIGIGDGYDDNTALPLIENFTAGGPRSVRGYEANTLGPRDSNNDPLGGALLVEGQAELIFPIPFTESIRQFRIAAFADAGNVFATASDFDVDELRASVGIAALWLSPLGPLRASFAVPLNSQPGDNEQQFQFTFGTGL